MKYRKMSLKESYEWVKEKRRIVNPNVGFVEQLGEFEKRLVENLEKPTLTIEDVHGANWKEKQINNEDK